MHPSRRHFVTFGHLVLLQVRFNGIATAFDMASKRLTRSPRSRIHWGGKRKKRPNRAFSYEKKQPKWVAIRLG
jgi:hypothetical protein